MTKFTKDTFLRQNAPELFKWQGSAGKNLFVQGTNTAKNTWPADQSVDSTTATRDTQQTCASQFWVLALIWSGRHLNKKIQNKSVFCQIRKGHSLHICSECVCGQGSSQFFALEPQNSLHKHFHQAVSLLLGKLSKSLVSPVLLTIQTLHGCHDRILVFWTNFSTRFLVELSVHSRRLTRSFVPSQMFSQNRTNLVTQRKNRVFVTKAFCTHATSQRGKKKL